MFEAPQKSMQAGRAIGAVLAAFALILTAAISLNAGKKKKKEPPPEAKPHILDLLDYSKTTSNSSFVIRLSEFPIGHDLCAK